MCGVSKTFGMSKKTEQITLRVNEEDRDFLAELETNHGLTETVLLRTFIAELKKTYKEEGYVSIPFRVVLEKPKAKKR
jgi:hypothetical protein